MSNPLSLGTVNTGLQSAVGSAEKALDAALKELAKDPSNAAKLQEVSKAMNTWTLATQMQSNTMKSMSEAMKSISQNIR